MELHLYEDDSYFQNQISEWIEELKLTQIQIEQLKAIEIQYFSQTSQLKQELYQAEYEFDKLLVSSASNQQVRQEQQKHATLKMKALEVFTEQFLCIREVLTQAQILQVCASHVTAVEELNFDDIIQRRQRFYENCDEQLRAYLEDEEKLSYELRAYLRNQSK